MHYNGSNSFLFVNATKVYQFKAKDFEIEKYPLCLRNISKDFTAINMKKKQKQKQKKKRFNRHVYEFSVHYIIGTSNMINIHKYLIKKHDIKECLG